MRAILILVVTLAFFGIFSISEAHELKSRGAISVTFHIDPNDEPVANEISNLEFNFLDKEGGFDIPNCDCILKISRDNDLLANINIAEDKDSIISDLKLIYPYIFTEKGRYKIALEGKVGTNEDDNISFDFTVNVNREIGDERTLYGQFLSLIRGHGLHILLFGGAILASLIVIITDKSKWGS